MSTEGDDGIRPSGDTTGVADTAAFRAAIAEAMYDHGRWERPGPPPPGLDWTVTSSAGKGWLRRTAERLRVLLRR